jgi:dihydroneopterin aldolase
MPCRIEAGCELFLFLGCTEEERGEEQPVELRLTIESPEGFAAGHTDELGDTLDVQALRATAARAARAARVRTLERLAALLEAALRAEYPQPGLRWELRLEKHRAEWTYVQTWRT